MLGLARGALAIGWRTFECQCDGLLPFNLLSGGRSFGWLILRTLWTKWSIANRSHMSLHVDLTKHSFFAAVSLLGGGGVRDHNLKSARG